MVIVYGNLLDTQFPLTSKYPSVHTQMLIVQLSVAPQFDESAVSLQLVPKAASVTETVQNQDTNCQKKLYIVYM